MSDKHTILYAEDDPDDVFIVTQAFKNYHESIHIVHASNGLEAVQYLHQLTQKKTYPCLVIMDINMPGMNGRDALVHIRQSETLKDIPVVLFTTSSSHLDQEFARRWSAGFITKPLAYDELEGLAKKFVDLCDFEMSNRP
ncbi:MAG: response regulator [Bacteroidota bacterium]|nr:response regulator [Flavisolibacter sp.]MDQ3843113.1 response regulator [Bacteroidota bacterium]MBD0296337.1 response regulator [Flavisolibacter sp.]MBD0351058.1 response regulator [Flavisolibacter sp.]MBD0367402.1 response regulator [Flavisolibacter sp.]